MAGKAVEKAVEEEKEVAGKAVEEEKEVAGKAVEKLRNLPVGWVEFQAEWVWFVEIPQVPVPPSVSTSHQKDSYIHTN